MIPLSPSLDAILHHLKHLMIDRHSLDFENFLLEYEVDDPLLHCSGQCGSCRFTFLGSCQHKHLLLVEVNVFGMLTPAWNFWRSLGQLLDVASGKSKTQQFDRHQDCQISHLMYLCAMVLTPFWSLLRSYGIPWVNYEAQFIADRSDAFNRRKKHGSWQLVAWWSISGSWRISLLQFGSVYSVYHTVQCSLDRHPCVLDRIFIASLYFHFVLRIRQQVLYLFIPYSYFAALPHSGSLFAIVGSLASQVSWAFLALCCSLFRQAYHL